MNFGKSSNEKIISILYIIVLGIYTVILIPQIQKRFIGDEIAFVKAAIGVETAGLPIYSSLNNEIQYALWHPPLYLNILGASFKIFGVHEWSARILSVFFTLATLYILYRFTKDLSHDNKITFLSCFLFLLNPLIVQGSLVIDIDNGILMFLMTLFIYVYYIIDKKKPHYLILLGIIFGIVLWAKLPTPPLIIVGIIVFNLLNKNLKKGVQESLIIGFVGVTVFLGTWFIYTKLLDLPFLMPFTHNSRYLMVGDSLHFMLTHLWGLKNIIFWANPFFILLVFIISIKRLIKYINTRKLDIYDLLLIIGLLIFFQYLFVGSYQTQDFPRYFIPMIPLFSILVADFLAGLNKGFEGKSSLFGLILIITYIYVLFFVRDPLLIDRIIFQTGSIYDIVMKTAQAFLLYLSPFVVSYILLKIARTKNAAIIALFLSLIALNVSLDISHSKADYYTGYFHGEKGMDKIIDYSRSYIHPGDASVLREDVAYYLSVKDYYSLPVKSEDFDKMIHEKNISYLIIHKDGYFTSLQYQQVLDNIDNNFKLIKKYGDFRLFEKIDR